MADTSTGVVARTELPKSLKRRKPKRITPPTNALRTPAEAAARLRCSIKTLNAHVAAGALRYIAIGRGTKRPHKMFTDGDLDQFIAGQTRTRKDTVCPSSKTQDRRTGASTSRSEVVVFSARPKRPSGATPKR